MSATYIYNTYILWYSKKSTKVTCQLQHAARATYRCNTLFRNARAFGMINTYGCIYLKIKKASAKVPGFGGAQKYACCRMLFSLSTKCICCNTRDFGMVDTYGCIYLKIKKASAEVPGFGGAQKYTCCRMLFSHSSKCISLGACARDKAFFTPPHI